MEREFSKKGFRILVVDDEPMILSLMTSMLGKLDCSVTTAHSGQEAITKLTGSVYSLVITDFSMPTINGYQLATWIKQHHPRTRVMIMTGGCNTNADRLKTRDNIVDAWLLKPFGLTELRNVISNLEFLDAMHSCPVSEASTLKSKPGGTHPLFPWGHEQARPRREGYENKFSVS